jgi:arylsulfatase A-like enzyme
MPSTPPLVPKNAVVLLFTIDAMRADILVKDAHAKLLPNLSALRRESVDFTQARSPSPQTNASITTLFAGKYFSQLYWSIKPGGIMTIPCAHEDPTPRFPEMLAQGGVDTVTFSGMPGLVNAYGIVKGFKEEEVIPGRPFATAKQITDVALERLRRQGNGPLFLYIHFTDPHAPYDLAGKHGTEFDRYLREVALVDDAIGRFRQAITELAIEDRTTIIVSADHGEAFGEHRTRHHATTVYEELLRVPLMIRVPGVRPRAVRAPVALIDVGPTVLDLMGHPTPRSYMGQSLVPYLRGQDATLDRPLAFESSRHLRAMVFADGFKAILNRKQGTAEVYDLVHDPKELRNLVDEGGVDAQARVDTLRAFFRVHELRRSGYVIPYIR